MAPKSAPAKHRARYSATLSLSLAWAKPKQLRFGVAWKAARSRIRLVGDEIAREERGMTRRGYFLRLALSVLVDLLDFTLGRIPIFGTVQDGAATLLLAALWGPVGFINFWEVLEVTDQIDGFIPTATLIGLYVGWKHGFLFSRAPQPGSDVQ